MHNMIEKFSLSQIKASEQCFKYSSSGNKMPLVSTGGTEQVDCSSIPIS